MNRDEKNTNHKIWDILKLNFNNLRIEEKKIILDIYYFYSNDVFLQGILKERALEIWSNTKEKRTKENMKYTLNTLINQLLIKIDKNRIIKIYDQLPNIGRKIIEIKL